MLARFSWLLDLLTHFRVHYCVAFAVLLVASLCLRRFAVALAACAGAIVAAAPLLSYVSFPSSTAAANANAFRLVTFNVWFRNADAARAAAYLEQTDADLVVIQEASAELARQMQALAPRYRYAHIDPHFHGAAVLSKWPFVEARSLSPHADGAPVAYVRIRRGDAELTVIGVHLHWPLGGRNTLLRNRELAALAQLAAQARGPTLIAGDLNLTQWSPHFRDLVRDSGLEDCALGRGLAPSWPSHASWLGIRIDHCLASIHWRTLDVRVGPHVGSDHRPVVAELVLEES